MCNYKEFGKNVRFTQSWPEETDYPLAWIINKLQWSTNIGEWGPSLPVFPLCRAHKEKGDIFAALSCEAPPAGLEPATL